ncbi:MAG: hypothetical protein H0T85_01425 [Geodermatophilaceae bacterium]|nr:hypothetical protein [Geodermatophilaceae bacterium]
MDEELPAESIVPIAVVLDERTGYTLWAPPWEEDDEEWQAFLGADGKIFLFTTPGQLAHYLSTDAEHDLTDHPSWSAIRRVGRRALLPTGDFTFDLDGIYDVAAGGADRWSVGELADVIDMVERMAECCEVDEVGEHLGVIPGLGLLDDGHEVFTGRSGEAAWTEIAEGIGEHWEPVLEALEGALTWVEPVVLDDDDAIEDDIEDDDTDDDEVEVEDSVGAVVLRKGDTEESADRAGARAAGEFWESVGIVPVSITVDEGRGLTMRCYVEDNARFLGRDLTVDVFRTEDGLVDFVEQGEPHDLAELSTWGQVVEADAAPIAAEEDTYDLSGVAAMLEGTSPVWDLGDLVQAAEGALDLAEYCHLERVTALLSPGTELGDAVADAEDDGAIDGDADRPDPEDLALLAEQWNEVVAEISTCLRWRD